MHNTHKISQPSDQKAEILTAIPGPKSQELRRLEDERIAPGVQNFALLTGIVVDSASGSTVTDVDGNTFLDIIGGIGVNGLGHSHPRFVSAIQEQVAKVSVGSFTSKARVDLLGRLAEHSPGGAHYRAQLYSSGAAAVESALRLAKSATGKFEFASFWGGFHGKTQGVLSLMGSQFKNGLGPMVSGSHILPYPDPYRPPFDTQASLSDACLDFARKQLKMASCGKLAAFIVEPIQGTAGNIIPPKGFLSGLAELAKEFGALVIADEMITGFGRTGEYWGAQHDGLEADIVTIGKQFGGGYPISGLLARSEIANSEPWAKPSGSSSSYGGNALASAAAATTLQIIDEENLVQNSREVGAYFLEKLGPFEEKYPFVGKVRGRGLMIGLELVTDKNSKEPLSKKVCERLQQEHLKRGLLTMAYAPSFRIQPAMTIDKGTVDEIVSILAEVFDDMAEKNWWR